MAGLKIHATRRLLAHNVVRLRKKKKWSQTTLAGAAQMGQSEISEIEKCNVSTGVDILQRIAHALSVPVAELFDESEQP
jgi:transcriptional regulator with XRE-family HTH domain